MSLHQELITHLKASGCRLTPQREIVLSVLASSGAHLSADEILRRVRRAYPYLNKSVVYRNLDLLTRLGIVSQTDLGQGCVQYELHRHPHHHHLVCRHCHSTQEIAPEVFQKLEKELRAHYAFAADLDHFAIFGLCRSCRRKRDRPIGHHPHSQM